MQTVPVQPVANQSFQITLSGQNCIIDIYQTAFGLFMDVSIGATLIIGGVVCENLNRIIRDAYLGFSGDFAWFDTHGTDDPIYTGIGGAGARFQLFYLTPADLALAGFSG